MIKTDKPIAVVLGGTNPHKALVENLKERGYYTVLIDYLENPPARLVADIHIRESTLDKERVLEIAKEIRATLVLAICIDQANAVASYVSEIIGLPTPYTYDTAVLTTDKILMKRTMIENGIPTSKYIKVRDGENIDSIALQFPVVVKPKDTTGSKGVKRINKTTEIQPSLNNAIQLSRSRTAIIEEYKEGMEVQIDCFVRRGKVHILMLNQKNKISIGADRELQSVGSIIPANITSNALAAIEKIANRLVLAFNFDNTPFFIQAIVNDDEVNVIEFAPRIGGGLSYRIINLYTGFDTLDHAIDYYTNTEKEIIVDSQNGIFSTNNIYTERGVFSKITGFETLKRNGVIEEFYQYKTKGSQIGGELSSNNRVGSFIIKAINEMNLLEKTKKAYDTIKVYNEDNVILPLRQLYKY